MSRRLQRQGRRSNDSIPFSPKSLSGLVAWYRSDLGMVQSGNVLTWSDQSGNGYTATAGATPPVATANQINGKVCPLFGGAAYMTTSAFSQALTSSTIVAVAKCLDGAERFMADGLAAGNRQALESTGNTNLVDIYAGSALNATVTAGMQTTAKQAIGCFGGASSTLYIDGSLLASGSAGTQTMTGLTIGARYTTADFFWNGPIGEIIIYNRALSTSEANLLHAYAKSFWSTA